MFVCVHAIVCVHVYIRVCARARASPGGKATAAQALSSSTGSVPTSVSMRGFGVNLLQCNGEHLSTVPSKAAGETACHLLFDLQLPLGLFRVRPRAHPTRCVAYGSGNVPFVLLRRSRHSDHVFVPGWSEVQCVTNQD